jgi:hypothetical protein
VDFGAISERRKLALAAFDWCGVCGLPFGAESRWQVVVTPADDDRPLDQLEFGEAPVARDLRRLRSSGLPVPFLTGCTHG